MDDATHENLIGLLGIGGVGICDGHWAVIVAVPPGVIVAQVGMMCGSSKYKNDNFFGCIKEFKFPKKCIKAMLKKMMIYAYLLGLCAFFLALPVFAAKPLQVAVVGSAPPMSYVNEQGRLTGFNVELAHALCRVLEERCEFKLLELRDVIESVATRQVDFAVVSLLITPERQAKVLFTKPLYRSMSVWLSSAPYPSNQAATPIVAVVQGTAQHRYATDRGWTSKVVGAHTELLAAIPSGQFQAALLPMATSAHVIKDPRFTATGWRYELVNEPALSGDVAISVNPQLPQLRERLNDAIDKLKRDGRFDKINTEFLPFKLQ